MNAELQALADAIKRVEVKVDTILAIHADAPVVPDEELLTVKEAMKKFKLARSTIYRLRESHVPVGGKGIRISPSALVKAAAALRASD